MTWHLHVEGHTDDPAEEQSLKEKVVAFVHELTGKHTVTASSFSGPTMNVAPHTEPAATAAPAAGPVDLDEAEQQVSQWQQQSDAAASGEASSAPEPSATEPPAEEPVPAPTEGRAAPIESVDLGEAEQQIAAWRQEDEALLGEAPETAPAPTAEEAPPPASADEGEIAVLRQEDEALLGEALETAPTPTAEEATPPAASGS